MSGAPSPWKPQADRGKERESKREAVVRAAARAFNEKGFYATSLDDIATALNISKPTVYYWGESKEALLAACYSAALDTLDAGTRATGATEAPSPERLRVLIIAYAEAILSDYGLCLTRVADTALSPPLRARVRATKRIVDRRIRDVLQDGAADGGLAVTDVKLTAFAIAGALNAAALWFEEDGERSRREIGEHYADLFVAALARR